jgi:hypothetical protein
VLSDPLLRRQQHDNRENLREGKVRSACDFIVQTNHDVESTDHRHGENEKRTVRGLEAFLEDSAERRDCFRGKWDDLVRGQEKKKRGEERRGREGEPLVMAVREEILRGWAKAYPIMNEYTHFACILDVKAGSIRWLERGAREEDGAEVEIVIAEV